MIESFFLKSTRKLNFISKLSYNLDVFEHGKKNRRLLLLQKNVLLQTISPWEINDNLKRKKL